MSTDTLQVNAMKNVGPVIVAVVLNSWLTGLCCMQYATYYRSGYKDKKRIKLLVPWCAMVDLAQFCSGLSLVWDYAVMNFGSEAISYIAPFGFKFTPIITAASSLPIQVFLAYRVKVLTGKMGIYYFVILSVLSGAQAGFAFACTACFVKQKISSEFAVCTTVAAFWLGLAIFVDVAITVLLFVYLSRSRSGFSKTNTIVTRILIRSIETAVFVTTFIIDLLTFIFIKGTTVHITFQLPIGRIYTNTLLLTLNSRIRDKSGELIEERDKTSNSHGGSSTGRQAQVAISVHREIQHDIHMNSFNDRSIGKNMHLVDQSENDLDRKAVV